MEAYFLPNKPAQIRQIQMSLPIQTPQTDSTHPCVAATAANADGRLVNSNVGVKRAEPNYPGRL